MVEDSESGFIKYIKEALHNASGRRFKNMLYVKENRMACFIFIRNGFCEYIYASSMSEIENSCWAITVVWPISIGLFLCDSNDTILIHVSS